MRIGKLILPLLSSEGHPLAEQHRDVAEALLVRFGQFVTYRGMCITRTALPPGAGSSDNAEHAAIYEPNALATDEDWVALNDIGESFKVAVAKVNEAEAAELAQELARSAAEGETSPVPEVQPA